MTKHDAPLTPQGQSRRARQADRPPLTRDRALRTAVELADRDGIEAVSMRNLAGLLGVVPMALYKHVASKDDLLDGMVDVVIGEYDPPQPSAEWAAAIRARVLSARRALLRHPWARAVIETRTRRTPSVLAYMDSLAGMFIEGGFSPDLTHHVMHALGHRIWGFSPEAFDDPESLDIPADPRQRAELVAFVSATYPNITAIAQAAADNSGDAPGGSCDEQFEFEFTLDLLLEAFARLHAAGWSSRRA